MKFLDIQLEHGSDESLRSSPFDYEWLFAASGEPVLIVDAATECIIEANPSALRVLHTSSATALSAQLAEVFAPECADLLRAGLTQALVQQRTTLLSLRPREGLAELHANLSMFRTISRSYFLVRLALKDPAPLLGDRRATKSIAFDALDGASFGFVMTDAAFRIGYANSAFVAMLNRRSQAELLGSALEGWLTLTPNDKSELQHQLTRRIALTRLVTTLRRRHHPPSRVAVEAICVPEGADSTWGFAVKESPAPH